MSYRDGGPVRSSVHIARLLDGEGYTEEIVARVERWQRRQVKDAVQTQQRFEQAKAKAGKVFSEMSQGDKKTIGRFIAMHDRMSFEAGIKVGLTTAFYGDDT